MQLKSLLIALGLSLGSLSALANATAAPQSFQAIDGITNPEDLVVLNDQFIVASGMAAKSGLHLIDTQNKTASRWAFGQAEKLRYTDCEKLPEMDELQAHGLSLTDWGNGKATLYVVNHGGKETITDLAKGGVRETVEIFEADYSQEKPTLTWLGCVRMPENTVANSVVADTQGTIYTSVLMHSQHSTEQILQGEKTGAIYRRLPNATQFERLNGTELNGNNGLALSKDGKTLYVAAMQNIAKFSTDDFSQPQAVRKIGYGIADNLRWTGERLTTAAYRTENCPENSVNFSCLKGWHYSEIDPDTLVAKPIATGDIPAEIAGVSVAVPHNQQLWFGTFHGNQITYLPIEK